MIQTRKKRVLCLIKGLGLGGAENLLCMALPYLDREQFDYEVGYFLPWKDALVSQIEQQGIPVTCFGIKKMTDLRAVWRVQRHLQKGKFDIVHAHLPWAGIVGRLAATVARTPLVLYTEHGLSNRLNSLTRVVNRMSLRLNDVTIAVSADVAKSMRGIPQQRIRTIPNGIDFQQLVRQPSCRAELLREFGISQDDLVIGKIANLSPVKNHETLIQAFAEFQQQHARSALLLVGQLRDRQELLQALARRLGVGERVVFTGPREDVCRILSAIDVFAMSSISEGLPISLLEAMARGLPVVCTAVGGIPAVVQAEQHGMLVPVKDPTAMSQAFLRLANDHELRRTMGAAGSRRVREEFDIAKMVQEVERIYLETLAMKGASPQQEPAGKSAPAPWAHPESQSYAKK